MAVIESKGDGYSLFNGVKLPSLPEWDKETYPYANIVHDDVAGTYILDFFTGRMAVSGSSQVAVESGTKYIEYDLDESGVWTTSGRVGTVRPLLLDGYPLVWTNNDIIDQADNSVYLAASDPIPLDGMNVIEWDGDTEGFEMTAESTSSATRYKVSNTIVPIDGDNYIVASVSGDKRTVSAGTLSYYESGGYYWAGIRRSQGVFCAVDTTVAGTLPGVQFISNGSTVYHSLFAYYPIETGGDLSFIKFLASPRKPGLPKTIWGWKMAQKRGGSVTTEALTTADGYALQDSNGLYLIPKEGE